MQVDVLQVVVRLVKKKNAQRKECLCGKKQINDKANKNY